MSADSRTRHVVRLLVGFTVTIGGRTAVGQNPEFRAMWVTRFEWPDVAPSIAQARIDEAMAALAAYHFNAVFFQVRGQADVLYPSPYEVWSPLIGGADPGWDPLAYAIDSAHANGIEFHAYINTHTCWQSSAHAPPANPNHLFYAHCDASDPQARDWLIHDSAGSPVQWHENDYVWIAPGVPAFQSYLREQVLYVVENYDVDGVHFDRIRTPNSSFSYDPISLSRYADAQSNPAGLGFHEWTADQITRNVGDIYAAIMAAKPSVDVSAAVFSNPSTAPASQHQDALAWAQNGSMDILVPMMYFSGGAGSTWDTRLQLWLAGSGGRHVVAGHITSQGLTSLLGQIALTRLRGAEGNSVFSWGSFDFWSDYLAGPYSPVASVPAMPWKDSPTTGIIYGFARNAAGAAVVDAQVVRDGSAYAALSSGDGLYSLLEVPPGTYGMVGSHPAHGDVSVADVSVGPGDVVRRDIIFAGLLAPIIAEVTPDPDFAIIDLEYQEQMVLEQGIADAWTLIEGPPGATVSASGLVRGWAPSVGDAGQTINFTVRASNPGGSDDESWRVIVQPEAPCTELMLSDFEGYADGAEVLFNDPRYSGSTVEDLEPSPNVAEVTHAVTAFRGTGSHVTQWQFVDTDPQRWMRLTTFNADEVPNPTVALDRPIRVRLRLESGRLRLVVGIRETGTTAALGEDGGTSGTIEWIGADADVNGAPQGVVVDAMPGVWQTFIFDPANDPIHGFTGDGVLATATNKGVFEHLGFCVVDTVGPFTLYLDDVELLCGLPDYGDLNHDGDVSLDDYTLLSACLLGPGVSVLAECQEADADGDLDVDLDDFRQFQVHYSR